METPMFKLSDIDCENVYEPAEDSFLLMDTLEADLMKFGELKPNICMEIGSGSGVIVTSLAMAFKRNNWPCHFIAVDINPNACRVTKNTGVINSTTIDVIRMDLASSIRADNPIDIMIFNPPYVVTESGEVDDEGLISKAWAGGENGREVMDKLFPFVRNLLSEKGLFYLVVIEENNPSDIINIFEGFHMTGEIVGERKIRGEHLYILRFQKIPKF